MDQLIKKHPRPLLPARETLKLFLTLPLHQEDTQLSLKRLLPPHQVELQPALKEPTHLDKEPSTPLNQFHTSHLHTHIPQTVFHTPPHTLKPHQDMRLLLMKPSQPPTVMRHTLIPPPQAVLHQAMFNHLKLDTPTETQLPLSPKPTQADKLKLLPQELKLLQAVLILHTSLKLIQPVLPQLRPSQAAELHQAHS